MPRFDVVASCPIHRSFRVEQIVGMFDMPATTAASERFAVELPTDRDDWQIGLIVGPSGSGKSTVARRAFADSLATTGDWPADRAVIDGLGELPIRQLIGIFTAVGFSSPPAWIKPYQVLSCGERFRCDLARALARALACTAPRAEHDATRTPTVAFDEFTSVVDRTVAKVAAASLAKSIRQGSLGCRFVAITCHDDIARWLAPDWTLDMATRTLHRRRLRRPAIRLAIHRCATAAWELFKRHHYLTAALAPQARCFLTTWNDTPVAFCATLPMIARRRHRRFTRVVTLPDFQGLGIGMRTLEAVAALDRANGERVSVTSSHPALVSHCGRSPLWRLTAVKRAGRSPRPSAAFPHYRSAIRRAVVSFEYCGPPAATTVS